MALEIHSVHVEIKTVEGSTEPESYWVGCVDRGALFGSRADAELFVRAKALPPTAATLDIGDGQTTPAEVRLHLNDDGTVYFVNSGAGALWAQKQGKFIKIFIGEKQGAQGDFEAKRLHGPGDPRELLEGPKFAPAIETIQWSWTEEEMNEWKLARSAPVTSDDVQPDTIMYEGQIEGSPDEGIPY